MALAVVHPDILKQWQTPTPGEQKKPAGINRRLKTKATNNIPINSNKLMKYVFFQ